MHTPCRSKLYYTILYCGFSETFLVNSIWNMLEERRHIVYKFVSILRQFDGNYNSIDCFHTNFTISYQNYINDYY